MSDAAMTLSTIAYGHLAARCLQVIAALGVADAIGEAPVLAADIARTVGGHAPALERMLRLAAMHGVFNETASGWAHTPASRVLREDHPRSMRALVRMMGAPFGWAAAGGLMHTARSGRSGAAAAGLGNPWDYYAAHPEEARVFNAAMTAKSHTTIGELLVTHDFRGYRIVADIGGGTGHFLAAILQAAPDASGILFDLPEVVAEAAPTARLRTQPGSFFEGPAPAANAYLLSNVLHDWGDADCVRILRTVRAAAPAGAELLVLEMLLPDGAEPDPSKALDIVMLMMTNGRERRLGEYAALLREGGFRLRETKRTAGPYWLLIAEPV